MLLIIFLESFVHRCFAFPDYRFREQEEGDDLKEEVIGVRAVTKQEFNTGRTLLKKRTEKENTLQTRFQGLKARPWTPEAPHGTKETRMKKLN